MVLHSLQMQSVRGIVFSWGHAKAEVAPLFRGFLQIRMDLWLSTLLQCSPSGKKQYCQTEDEFLAKLCKLLPVGNVISCSQYEILHLHVCNLSLCNSAFSKGHNNKPEQLILSSPNSTDSDLAWDLAALFPSHHLSLAQVNPLGTSELPSEGAVDPYRCAQSTTVSAVLWGKYLVFSHSPMQLV